MWVDPLSAARIASARLADLAERWTHVQVVAEVAGAWGSSDIVAAAWLHDVGYSPDVRVTGFHALDGAVYLRDLGLPPEVVSLVAYHTGAEFEAEERGLEVELAQIGRPRQDQLDALTLCDLTVSPTGARISVGDRLDEVLCDTPTSTLFTVRSSGRDPICLRPVNERPSLRGHPRNGASRRSRACWRRSRIEGCISSRRSRRVEPDDLAALAAGARRPDQERARKAMENCCRTSPSS